MIKSNSDGSIYSGVKKYKRQLGWKVRNGTYGSISKVRLVDLEEDYKKKMKDKLDTTKSKRLSFALKEANLATKEEEDLFINEVLILENFHTHKHIVGFEECFLKGLVGCIILELCKPKDLHTVLLDESIKLDDLTKLDYCIQIANGMSFLHSNRIVHRDLKPNNVLFSRDDNTIRICDFGSSKKIENTKSSKHGTPEFIAPEVFNEKLNDALDPRKLDIFSFGTIMWMMWARCEPFVGYNGKNGKINLVNDISYSNKRPNICAIYGKAPRGIIELITECWCSYPSGRPESFAKIEFRLKRIRFKLKNSKQLGYVSDEEQAYIDEQYEEYQEEKKWEEEENNSKKVPTMSKKGTVLIHKYIEDIKKRRNPSMKRKTRCFPLFFSF
jgi:serine/threonine protein kinase